MDYFEITIDQLNLFQVREPSPLGYFSHRDNLLCEGGNSEDEMVVRDHLRRLYDLVVTNDIDCIPHYLDIKLLVYLGVNIVDGHYRGWDFWCDEYIRSLALFISELRENLDHPVTIVELGAGSGRLSALLNKVFRESCIDCHSIATNIETSDHQYIPLDDCEVEVCDYKEALQKYHPDIVLVSWIPAGQDWTSDIRNTDSVSAYILIGPINNNRSGHLINTWGHCVKNPIYQQEGFEKTSLHDLSQYQFCRYQQKSKDWSKNKPREVPSNVYFFREYFTTSSTTMFKRICK